MDHQTDTLWRYIELYKFEDLIEKQSLYLLRLDKLDDSKEGYRSEPSKARDIKLWNYLQVPDLSVRNDEMEESNRTFCFVNCWNRSPCQTRKMWEGYPGAVVAIKTTVASLKSSVQFESTIDYFKRTRSARTYMNEILHKIQFGDISYINFEKDLSNPALTLSCFHKEKDNFDFENEFRVCVQAWSPDRNADGETKPLDSDHLYVQVRLASLIHEVFMNPLSSDMEREKVDCTLAKRGLLIRASRLREEDIVLDYNGKIN